MRTGYSGGREKCLPKEKGERWDGKQWGGTYINHKKTPSLRLYMIANDTGGGFSGKV